MSGMSRCVCGANSVFIFTGLAVVVCIIFTTEGTLADDPSRDASKDTSEEENDAVFRSIKPLESAIMPVSQVEYRM